MVATNGHRLAKMEIPVDSSYAPSNDFIVPPKALEQVRRLFPAEEELGNRRGENHIGFRSPFTSVFSRLIEGPYPNYELVIPRDNDRNAVADKGALISALKRMSVVASDQTHRIRLSFNSGMLKFSVQTLTWVKLRTNCLFGIQEISRISDSMRVICWKFCAISRQTKSS